MHLRPDIHTALWVAALVIVTLAVWRTAGGLIAANSTTEPLGKAMLSITG